MKEITLHIDENKFKTFLDFIKTLDYVSISNETNIPKSQQEEVSRRIKLIKKGEMKTRSWDEARKEIFKR